MKQDLDSPIAPFEVSLRFQPCPSDSNVLWLWDISIAADHHSIQFSHGEPPLLFSEVSPPKDLRFFRIFEEFEDNYTVFDQSCLHQVERVLQGQDSTVITCGAASTGKTFTLYGVQDECQEASFGVAQQAVQRLLEADQSRQSLSISMSFLEIKNDTIVDLLKAKPKQVKGVKTMAIKKKGQVQEEVQQIVDIVNLPDFQKALFLGLSKAGKGHTVLKLEVSRRDEKKKIIEVSTLTFVELAGFKINMVLPAEASLRIFEREELVQIETLLKNSAQSIESFSNPINQLPGATTKMSQLLQPVLTGKSFTSVICTLGSSIEEISQTCYSMKMGSTFQRLSSSLESRAVQEAAIEAAQKETHASSPSKVSQLPTGITGISKDSGFMMSEVQTEHKKSPDAKKISPPKSLKAVEVQVDFASPHLEDLARLEEENRRLHLEIKNLQEEQAKSQIEFTKLEERVAASLNLNKSPASRSSSQASVASQTETTEYSLFGEIIRHLMGKFPDLRTKVIHPEGFMQLFLIFNQMQSDLIQEIREDPGVQGQAECDQLPSKMEMLSSSSRPSTVKLEDLVEKSDLFSSQKDFQSLISRGESSILSIQSKRQLEMLMQFDPENPLDTQKVLDFIDGQKRGPVGSIAPIAPIATSTKKRRQEQRKLMQKELLDTLRTQSKMFQSDAPSLAVTSELLYPSTRNVGTEQTVIEAATPQNQKGYKLPPLASRGRSISSLKKQRTGQGIQIVSTVQREDSAQREDGTQLFQKTSSKRQQRNLIEGLKLKTPNRAITSEGCDRTFTRKVESDSDLSRFTGSSVLKLSRSKIKMANEDDESPLIESGLKVDPRFKTVAQRKTMESLSKKKNFELYPEADNIQPFQPDFRAASRKSERIGSGLLSPQREVVGATERDGVEGQKGSGLGNGLMPSKISVLEQRIFRGKP